MRLAANTRLGSPIAKTGRGKFSKEFAGYGDTVSDQKGVTKIATKISVDVLHNGSALGDARWPVSARSLLTRREQSFYEALSTAFPNHTILMQVALSQLIDVPEDHPDRHSIRAKYKQLVADFVLCTEDLQIVAVIEVDDRTHERPARRFADARKNKVLADAGLRLVRIPAGPLPHVERLQELLDTDPVLVTPAHRPVFAAFPPGDAIDMSLDAEIVAPESLKIEKTSAISGELRIVTLKLFASAFLVIGGWFMYSYVISGTARSNVRSRAPVVRSSPLAVHVAAPPRVVAAFGQSAPESAAQRIREAAQAEVYVRKEKNKAWEAYYMAPASCEHPASWADQVECGNGYMRAKKAFELRWLEEHPH